MNTLPTAEETYTKVTGCIINHKDVKTAMIEFAKLHVEAALKEAANSVVIQGVNGNAVINSYPLKNIK